MFSKVVCCWFGICGKGFTSSTYISSGILDNNIRSNDSLQLDILPILFSILISQKSSDIFIWTFYECHRHIWKKASATFQTELWHVTNSIGVLWEEYQLTYSHIQQICSRQLWKHLHKTIENLYIRKYNYLIKSFKDCGKRRNCSSWAISPFATMFIIGFCSRCIN